MYLLTRPRPKAATSQQAFTDAGVRVTTLAPVDIQWLQAGIQQFSNLAQARPLPDCIIFTSTFACEACTETLRTLDPAIAVIAVGDSTARCLQKLGVHARVPEEHTTEGLLALSELKNVKDKSILVIKGEGGRTTLLEHLEKTGAHVNAVTVYQRVVLKKPLETNLWHWRNVKGIIATSGEMAGHLFAHYDNDALRQQPWVTVSERVAQGLRELDITKVAVCHGASDRALIQWVKDNWE
ncbi:uroporphyrinogen-III synthase [Alteromonas pelagimontana]|uniref:Uroporphyrinogen-III synthase n=1 Tax=Alteromonas pelagimontana TaxID=1858656 RepID=A0A6M4ME66_9ALTE|nr:uroporphyrinogen-III synthase [Alteromonas pelagimontana]QJR81138.1 uroporphyrinogen-III synthase [Alteromonas pelagimontana]